MTQTAPSSSQPVSAHVISREHNCALTDRRPAARESTMPPRDDRRSDPRTRCALSGFSSTVETLQEKRTWFRGQILSWHDVSVSQGDSQKSPIGKWMARPKRSLGCAHSACLQQMSLHDLRGTDLSHVSSERSCPRLCSYLQPAETVQQKSPGSSSPPSTSIAHHLPRPGTHPAVQCLNPSTSSKYRRGE